MHCRGRGIQQRPGVPKSQSRHGCVGVYSPLRLFVRHTLYALCCVVERDSGPRTEDQGLGGASFPIGFIEVVTEVQRCDLPTGSTP